MSREVSVVSYARLPFHRAKNGSLKDAKPHHMGSRVVRAALEDGPDFEHDELGDVILGCSFPTRLQGHNLGRVVALHAELPEEVPGTTVDRYCASGFTAISTAAGDIRGGNYDIAVAGGVELMSMLEKDEQHVGRPEFLPDSYSEIGKTAELVAERFDISRREQDEFALTSHDRTLAAQDTGFLEGEIVEFETKFRDPVSGEISDQTVREDGIPREDLDLDVLSRFPAHYVDAGTVTATNSPPHTDGAAAVLLMARDRAESLGAEPMGILHESVTVGVPPEIMGTAPIPAVRQLLERIDLNLSDIDLFELNESFASTALHCIRELELDPQRVNVNGGAIAIGHPLGATGARLVGTLLRALEAEDEKWGIATTCAAGGIGTAMLVERTG